MIVQEQQNVRMAVHASTESEVTNANVKLASLGHIAIQILMSVLKVPVEMVRLVKMKWEVINVLACQDTLIKTARDGCHGSNPCLGLLVGINVHALV